LPSDRVSLGSLIEQDYQRRRMPALFFSSMMNYAAGYILIAAIRARTHEVHGPFVAGDSTWYSWVAPRLYRFGLERPARQVLEDFLGGPVSPAALLADMRRMKGERSSGAAR
jgi:hypothetical protein